LASREDGGEVFEKRRDAAQSALPPASRAGFDDPANDDRDAATRAGTNAAPPTGSRAAGGGALPTVAPNGRTSWIAEVRWDSDIRWDQELQSSCFYAVASPPHDDVERVVAESFEVEWPPTSDAGVHALVDAVDELDRSMVAVGWRPIEPGDAWYARRYACSGFGPPPESTGQTRAHQVAMASRAAAPSRRRAPTDVATRRVGLLLTTSAVLFGGLAVLSAAGTDPRDMTGLGLPTALPFNYYAAVAALIASFGATLSRRRLHGVALGAHVAAAIVALYAIAPLIEDGPRTAIAWKLAGIPDYISATGTVDPNIDAFFNWPGFFVVIALFTRLAGFDNPIEYAAWAPVVFNALYTVPLFLIARTASPDPRAPWLAVWLFVLANWIGQDYLAPQAAGYLLFLVVMAILLTWFTRSSRLRVPYTGERLSRLLRVWSGQMERTVAASTPRQRVGLLAIAVTIFAALVPSHQLTPFAAGAVIGALVLSGSLTTRGLPTLVLMLAFVWLSYMAVGYLEGHFEHVVAPVGSISENVSANYTSRLQGSPEHILVTYVRSATSLLVWLLAAAGAVRTAREGRLDLPSAIMVATPFALIPFQAYGGELLLRVYLFTLPGAVLLAAKALLPPRGARSSPTVGFAIVATGLVIWAGWVISRYGDERMHYFSPGDKAAVSRLYDVAEPHARLVALFDNVAWRYRDYKTYSYVSAEQVYRDGGIPATVAFLRGGDRPTYLVVTRSQLARGELTGGWTRATWQRLERALEESGTTRLIYANRDAKVFAVVRSRTAEEHAP
jgi:hypothetical protein